MSTKTKNLSFFTKEEQERIDKEVEEFQKREREAMIQEEIQNRILDKARSG